ncbi:MAG: alanine dehydrogenase [Dysgonamonadaceae bacterium]|nr:alanine dehydrogenase [Dysgonamonadaceae bacterium]MDD4727613.1 alanine dehydrogenase [Dysgonamonadaceae bacterium]
MIYQPFKSTSFVVREFLLKVNKTHSALVIGVPKEDTRFEKRLALTPEAVALLVDEGHKLIFESGAGEPINYSDNYYAESGATIVDTKAEVFEANLILKISPPTLQEVRLMRPRTTVFSFLLQPMLSSAVLEAMSSKRINGLAYDLVYYDDEGTSPFVTAISEIEGASAITLAAELMSNANGGKGILMGGVPGVSPTEVVIIGADVAGTIAARAALGLGALVKVFDNDINKLRLIQHSLGRSVFTSTLQPNVLRNNFRSADVLIGAMEYINQTHRDRISSDLIRELKKGALVIDLRLAQGGCFETTMEACLPGSPTMFEKYGILHFCEMSISSRVARTASMALSNIFSSLFQNMANGGGVIGLAQSDRGFSSGFYMFSGKMVNGYVANLFNLPVNDIGLFLPGL